MIVYYFSQVNYDAIKFFSLLKSLLEDDSKKLLNAAASDLKSTDSAEG